MADMRINSNVYLREIGGKFIIVTDSDLGIDYSKVVQLNESASFLISKVEGGRSFTKEEWVALLTEHYEVDEATARKDVDKLIETLVSMDVLEI